MMRRPHMLTLAFAHWNLVNHATVSHVIDAAIAQPPASELQRANPRSTESDKVDFDAPMSNGQTLPKLTLDNFETTRAKGLWMINYYAPHCRHCRVFEPMFRDLFSDYIPDSDNGFRFGHVDCEQEGYLCLKDNVWGTPTIRTYFDGDFSKEFSGQRTMENLVSFVEEEKAKYERFKELNRDVERESVAHLKRVIERATQREHINPRGEVQILDQDALEERTRFGPWLVEYMVQDGKHKDDVLKRAAKGLQGHTWIAKIDCNGLGACPNVHDYPTLEFSRNGETMLTYRGELPEAGIVELGHRIGAFSIPYIERKQYNHLVQTHPVFSLLLFDEHSSEKAVRSYAKAAEVTFSHLDTFASYSPDIMPSIPRPSVIILRKGDPFSPIIYKQDMESEFDMTYFIDHHRYGILQAITPFNMEDIMEGTELMVLGILDPSRHVEQMARLRDLGRDIRSRYMEFHQISGNTKDSTSQNTDDPETLPIRVAFMDSVRWTLSIQQMLNRPVFDVPQVILVEPGKQLYYERDEEGQSFKFESTSLLIRVTNLWRQIHGIGRSDLKAAGMYGASVDGAGATLRRWVSPLFERVQGTGHVVVLVSVIVILALVVIRGVWKRKKQVGYSKVLSEAKYQ